MNIECTVYRLNGQVVWTSGQSIDALNAIINRRLPDVGIRASGIVEMSAPIPSAAKATEPVAKVPGAGTKLDRAVKLYDPNKSRKEMIEIFCAELQMTPAGASTYHATCKRMAS